MAVAQAGKKTTKGHESGRHYNLISPYINAAQILTGSLSSQVSSTTSQPLQSACILFPMLHFSPMTVAPLHNPTPLLHSTPLSRKTQT